MKNIIIVTGGAGFIGSNLIELLIKKTKFNIISIDNYSSGNKKNHLINKKIKYINSHTKNISKVLIPYKNNYSKNKSLQSRNQATHQSSFNQRLKFKSIHQVWKRRNLY